MIKSEGVIFRTIPFGESSLILDIYTEMHGITKCIVGGIRKKKNNKQYLYQVPQIIDVIHYPGKGDKLKRIKEASLAYRYQNILSHVPINAIASCIIDFSRQSITESEDNATLFTFIKSALVTLDNVPANLPNFHLEYLFELTNHIGIFPRFDGEAKPYFNLKEGAFVISNVVDPHYCLSPELSEIFKEFLKGNGSTLKMNKHQRNAVLDALSNYYTFHLQNFKKPKSIDIIKVIFAT